MTAQVDGVTGNGGQAISRGKLREDGLMSHNGITSGAKSDIPG